MRCERDAGCWLETLDDVETDVEVGWCYVALGAQTLTLRREEGCTRQGSK